MNGADASPQEIAMWDAVCHLTDRVWRRTSVALRFHGRGTFPNFPIPARLPFGAWWLAASAEECIVQSGVVTVATPWPEFAAIPAERWARPGAPRVVIDCWRALQCLESVNGVRYIGLGVGVAREESAAGGAAQ